MVQKIRPEIKTKRMSKLPIYIFIFFIFFFFEKYPYQKAEKKSCNRAKIKKVRINISFKRNYSCTISARFAHDLFKIALHDFFYNSCKIVRKIVRSVESEYQYYMMFLNSFCTKAHFFSALLAGGYLNVSF